MGVAARFTLESFDWRTPDRLELSGRFAGVRQRPSSAPVLVVVGATGAHRLPAVPGSLAGSADEEASWRAEFVWDGPPVPVEAAELQLGGDLVVSLPEPGATRGRPAPVLEVQGGEPAAARIAELEAALETAEEALAGAQREARRQVAALEAQVERLLAQAGAARADAERAAARLGSLDSSAGR